MTKCKHCTPPKGLPILPVRYVIAPKAKGDSTLLPQWANSEKTNMVSNKLSDQSQLALRTMGKGFLYVLLKMQGVAELCWRVYSIDENGGFWRQRNAEQSGPQSVSESDALTGCDAGDHQSSDVAFITIEQAEKCDIAWFAYSRFKWTEEICNQYADLSDDGTLLRNQRMQKISPAAWINSQNEGNGIAKANKTNIADVLGFRTGSVELLQQTTQYPYLDLRYEQDDEVESKNKGINYLIKSSLSSSTRSNVFNVDMRKFTKRFTVTPWNHPLSAISNSEDVLDLKMNSDEHNDNHKPTMIVALWDSIGMVDEVQSWINQITANTVLVQDERQHEIGSAGHITTLKGVIEDGELLCLNEEWDERFSEYVLKRNIETYSEVYHKSGGESSPLLSYVWGKQIEQGCEIDQYLKTVKQFVQQAIWHKLIDERDLVDAEFKSENFHQADNTDLERFKEEAAYSYQWAFRHLINAEDDLAEYEKTVFKPIFELQNLPQDAVHYRRLRTALNQFQKEIVLKSANDKALFQVQAKERVKNQWYKYFKFINEARLTQFEQHYSQYLQAVDDYTALIVNDLIALIDCYSFTNNPFAIINDEYYQCSEQYHNFANDLLATLLKQVNTIEFFQQNPTTVQPINGQGVTHWHMGDNDEKIFKQLKLPEQEPFLFQLIKKGDNDNGNIFWKSLLSVDNQDNLLDEIDRFLSSASEDLNEYQYEDLISDISQILNLPEEESIDLTTLSQLEQIIDNDIAVYGNIVPDSKSWGEKLDNKLLSLRSEKLYLSHASFEKIQKLSGVLLALMSYCKAKHISLHSRWSSAIIASVGLSARLPKNMVLFAMKEFHRFTDALARKSQMDSMRIARCYEQLNNRVRLAMSSDKIPQGAAGFLLMLELISIVRFTQRIEDESMDNGVLIAQISSSIFVSGMLVIRMLQPTMRVAQYQQMLQERVKSGHYSTLQAKDLSKKLLGKYRFFMRFGNALGGIGGVLGLLPGAVPSPKGLNESLLSYSNNTIRILVSLDMISVAWTEKGLESLVKRILRRFAVGLAVRRVAGSLVGFLIHPYVGIALFVLSLFELLLDFYALETWFYCSRYGHGVDNDESLPIKIIGLAAPITLTTQALYWVYQVNFKPFTSYEQESAELYKILDVKTDNDNEKPPSSSTIEAIKWAAFSGV